MLPANTTIINEMKQEAAAQAEFKSQLEAMADFLSFHAPKFSWHKAIEGFEDYNDAPDVDSGDHWGLLLALTDGFELFDQEWVSTAFTSHFTQVGSNHFNSTQMKFIKWQNGQIYLTAVNPNIDITVQVSPSVDTEIDSRTSLFKLVNEGYSEGLTVWIDGRIGLKSGDIEPKKIELINLAEAA